MPLTPENWEQLLRGFHTEPLRPMKRPAAWSNPLLLRLHLEKEEKRFRLWCFEVTHGGKTRADGEYRVQVSNGPTSVMDEDGYKDMLLGYVPDDDAIVIYDSRYLDHYRQRALEGNRVSPSVQVPVQEIKGRAGKLHVFDKDTRLFGPTKIIVFDPDFLPAFLLNRYGLMNETITPEVALNKMPAHAPSLIEYCTKRGFRFPPHVVARYVAALSAKPFVILAGATGMGKSKLAQLSSEYFTLSDEETASLPTTSWEDIVRGNDKDLEVSLQGVQRDRIAFVPVRPDWTDNQALLGYFNPVLQRYEGTPALALILRASEAESAARAARRPASPYFLILDEMNLARVEHYFSDFLSLIESRRVGPDDTIEQEMIDLHSVRDASISVRSHDGDIIEITVPPRVAIPTNLYIIGTVNIDETTYGFSPKVLDRASIIEFHDVDLDALRGVEADQDGSPTPAIPKQLPPLMLAGPSTYQRAPDTLHNWMKAVNEVLLGPGLHVGYRGACEIALFIENYGDLFPDEDAERILQYAFDAALLQKVLPRLHGNRARLSGALARLHHVLRTGSPPPSNFQDARELEWLNRNGTYTFPMARARLAEMIAVLNQFGFVSFFR